MQPKLDDIGGARELASTKILSILGFSRKKSAGKSAGGRK